MRSLRLVGTMADVTPQNVSCELDHLYPALPIVTSLVVVYARASYNFRASLLFSVIRIPFSLRTLLLLFALISKIYQKISSNLILYFAYSISLIVFGLWRVLMTISFGQSEYLVRKRSGSVSFFHSKVQ